LRFAPGGYHLMCENPNAKMKIGGRVGVLLKLSDGSSVAAGFAVDIDESGQVTRARVAFGGVAATPVRAYSAEDAIIGERWSRMPVKRAQAALEEWERNHPRPPVLITDVADHADHIRNVAGIDHVGLGSDFDGINSTVTGLDGVDKYPALLAELARRGWVTPTVAQHAHRRAAA